MQYYSGGWLWDLTKEGVEPNPGSTWAVFLEAMKKQLGEEYGHYADDLKKNGKLYTQLWDWKRSQGKNSKMIDADVLFEFVAAERKEVTTAPLTNIFKGDDIIIRNILAVVDEFQRPPATTGIISYHIHIHIILYHIILTSSYLFCHLVGGWIRDLTRECVEPNPGPAWNELIEKLRKKMGDDFDDIGSTLDDIRNEIKKNAKVVTTDHVGSLLDNNDSDIMKTMDKDAKKPIREAIRELNSTGMHIT